MEIPTTVSSCDMVIILDKLSVLGLHCSFVKTLRHKNGFALFFSSEQKSLNGV